MLDIEWLPEVVDDTWEEPMDKTSKEWKTFKGQDEMAHLGNPTTHTQQASKHYPKTHYCLYLCMYENNKIQKHVYS